MDARVQATVLSDSQLSVTVPNTIALGTAQISVIRDVAGQGTDVRTSNVVTISLCRGYNYVTRRLANDLAVVDSSDNIIAHIPLTTSLPAIRGHHAG